MPERKSETIPLSAGTIADAFAALGDLSSNLAGAEAELRARELDWLNSLSDLPNLEAQAQAIDKALLEELVALLLKLRRLSKGQPPTPDQHWAITEELTRLIFKLIAKVFILQGQPTPKFDPRLGGIDT